MERMGYYAEDREGSLHQFTWDKEELIIKGEVVNPADYEIKELAQLTSDSAMNEVVKGINKG